MSDPNMPRLLREPRPFKRVEDDHVSGNPARDGFTRLAAARPQNRIEPFFPEYCGPGEIEPHVGERDYRFGPRYEDM